MAAGPPSRRRRRPSRRRLFGIDRSGPAPRETLQGQPLRPLTLPNIVGYVRLAALPAFLVIAFSSDDGRALASTVIYLLITVGDYVDGFLARATGQYSRLGALLDPLIDRLTVLSGAAVCWHFGLLPQWAIALLALRELVTLGLGQLAVRRGIEIEVNWVGRVGVFCVFSGIVLALAVDWWGSAALFLAGVAISTAATVIYTRSGLARA